MEVHIRDMVEADLGACAAMVTDSEIGLRYGFTREGMAGTLAAALTASGQPGSTQELLVAEAGASILGFAWIDLRGAFSSAPYLRLIAVDPQRRGSGVGALLLGEFETRGQVTGRYPCLLVSDFNASARAFYARAGYREIGILPDFARPGIGEVLMVKVRKAPGDGSPEG